MPFVGIGVGVGRQRFRGGFVGLLDEYSGAAAAYSLRQLSSTYTGDAIRVRRASDNTELNIGFVSNELDTATLESFCSGTNGFVTTWYDQSGNARNATQTTAANQPQIVSSGNVILDGGKATTYFNGNEFLINNITTNYSIYSELVVANNLGTTNFSIILAHSTGATASQGYLGTRNNGLNYGTFDITQRIFGSTTNNLALISRYKNSSNSITNYVNAILGDVYTSTQFTTPALIGTITQPTLQGPYIGNLSEIIFYPSNEISNRTGIETNINSHYGIY